MALVSLLSLSTAVASGFYSSILGYMVLEEKGIYVGAFAGSTLGTSVFSYLLASYPDMIAKNELSLHCALFGSHFWMVLCIGAWLFRDRFRPAPHDKLKHLYLEMVADGALMVNLPVSCVAMFALGVVVQELVNRLLKFAL